MTAKYYQEPNGDYLAVDPSTAGYYYNLGKREVEGRATALAGSVSSVCTVGIALAFLETCKRVKRADVPREWLEMF